VTTLAAVSAVVVAAGLSALVGWKVHRRAASHRRTDWGSSRLNWLDGLNRWFCQAYHRLPPHRLPLPDTGPAIVVSNHVSGLDPLLLIAAADRPLRFLIAREQYYRFGLQWLFRAVGCIPVDRQGRPERALREAFKALRAGEVLAIFPQGRIHLSTDPPRKLKGGAARLAVAVGCPLVPLRISGIRGEGNIVRAVFLRSHAKLAQLPVLSPDDHNHDSLMRNLEEMLA